MTPLARSVRLVELWVTRPGLDSILDVSMFGRNRNFYDRLLPRYRGLERAPWVRDLITTG